MRRLTLITTVVTALAVAVVLAFGPRGRGEAVAGAAVSPVVDYGSAPDFKLTDSAGRIVSSSELSGPWVANFIFTGCAKQCPMLTARMNGLKSRLPGVRLVSFSVDPRDSSQDLARFSRFYGADWLFLRGSAGEVGELVTGGFHLALAKDGKEILHSKSLVLVDAAGRIRGYFDGTDDASVEELVRKARGL